MDAAIWDEFASNVDDLRTITSAIEREAALQRSTPLPPVEESAELAAFEGRLLLRAHVARERNQALARKKKESAAAFDPRLPCEVCSFSFQDRYGDAGKGFIECHHVVPLAAAAPRRVTMKDLALVCPNCHRMLHRGAPPPGIAQLRALLRA
jgi:5-methylcytosine-specific restriction protein A